MGSDVPLMRASLFGVVCIARLWAKLLSLAMIRVYSAIPAPLSWVFDRERRNVLGVMLSVLGWMRTGFAGGVVSLYIKMSGYMSGSCPLKNLLVIVLSPSDEERGSKIWVV